MMTGILQPSSGKIVIDGREPYQNRREHMRNIGVVFGIMFLIEFMVGMVTFVTQSVWGVSTLKEVVIGFFAGTNVPLALFPDKLLAVANVLPFKSMYYDPVRMLTEESMDLTENQVYISSAYAEKYLLSEGDLITLKEAYKEDTYDFTVDGIYDYEGGLCVFMSREYLNRIFDLDKSYFAGYFSDSEITDIDSEYIGTVIGYDELTKISR